MTESISHYSSDLNEEDSFSDRKMQVLEGIPVSTGIAIGEALVIGDEGLRIPRRFINPGLETKELERLDQAIEKVSQDIATNKAEIDQALGSQYGAIFDAHQQMVQDQRLRSEINALVLEQGFSAEYAVSTAIKRYAKVFQELDSDYLKERANDLFDIEKRLLHTLLGARKAALANLESPCLILANNLTPSETANLNREFALGMATERGGPTSHTAIVANAFELPAVVGIGEFLSEVSGGDIVIIDGTLGRLILNPDPEMLQYYQKQQAESTSRIKQLDEELKDLPAITADGERIVINANVEFPNEIPVCLDRGCEGIGLYRTEFLYLGESNIPTEEDHFQAYKSVLEAMGDRKVIFRTLDLGADKLPSKHQLKVSRKEQNPFLGLRSIRLSLRELPLFRTQLRAILRASNYGNPCIMFPLISTLSELRQAKMILKDVQEDLEEEGFEFKSKIPIGMMVEVPAAALMIEAFISEVDFISIGTNDLIQYTIAVDRGNKDVANLFSASQPAVLKLIQRVIEVANAHNVSVNVCGQMSSDPVYLMLLLGFGLRQLSVTPNSVPELKRVCRMITIEQCQQVAGKIFTFDNVQDVTRYLKEELKQVIRNPNDDD